MGSMQLRDSPKHLGSGTHRIMSPEETFERIRPVADAIGVTRLADITGLDRIGIPVYSAIVPRSNDIVSVYNGKGTRLVDAKVGAVMEAIERYAAWTVERPQIIGSYEELRQSRTVLDPREIVVNIRDDYSDRTEIGWLEGFDLLRQERILVPFYAAAYFQNAADCGHLCYSATSTNGLASGNTVEEAICHALCEIIERDAWSLAELASRVVPNYLRESGSHLPEGDLADDLERYSCIDSDTIEGKPRELLELCRKAGMRVLLRDMTADTRIATILCTIADDLHDKLSPVHAGMGTHPDAVVALTRAITEAAQARAVDIQGLREDITMADEAVDRALLHSRRVVKVDGSTFYQTASNRTISFSEVCSSTHSNILDDIRQMLEAVQKAGCKRAIVVDFSRPELKASIVRVIVPGMESWAALRGRLGDRATRWMKQVTFEKQQAAAAQTNSQRIMDALFGSVSRS